MIKNRHLVLMVILLAGVILTSGCTGEGMTQANTGDTVKVHYTDKLDDGTVFDSSIDRERFNL